MVSGAKRYFKDYVLKEIPDKNGILKKTLVYCGDWYEKEQPACAKKREAVMFAVLGVISLVLLVLADCCNIGTNRDGFTGALGLASLVPAFLVCAAGIRSIFMAARLTKNEYRERLVMLRVCSILCVICFFLVGIGHLRYLLGRVQAGEKAHALAACLLMGFAFLSELAIAVTECRTGYRVIHHEEAAGKGCLPETG